MPMTPVAGTLPAMIWLVKYLSVAIRHMTLEERIENLARLVLVALLFATLGWIV
jgi:hypothetical protein